MGERVNKSELGRRFGVTEAAIRKAIKRGLLKEGSDGLLDFETSKALWETNRDPDKVLAGIAGGAAVSKLPQSGPALPETSLAKARTAHAAVAAQRQQLRLLKERGELIAVDDARRACLAVIGVVNERIEGAAAQIAVRVAGVSNVADCERIAKEILRAVRTEIAGLDAVVEVKTNEAA